MSVDALQKKIDVELSISFCGHIAIVSGTIDIFSRETFCFRIAKMNMKRRNSKISKSCIRDNVYFIHE